jgi:hypothetical protein
LEPSGTRLGPSIVTVAHTACCSCVEALTKTSSHGRHACSLTVDSDNLWRGFHPRLCAVLFLPPLSSLFVMFLHVRSYLRSMWVVFICIIWVPLTGIPAMLVPKFSKVLSLGSLHSNYTTALRICPESVPGDSADAISGAVQMSKTVLAMLDDIFQTCALVQRMPVHRRGPRAPRP